MVILKIFNPHLIEYKKKFDIIGISVPVFKTFRTHLTTLDF